MEIMRKEAEAAPLRDTMEAEAPEETTEEVSEEQVAETEEEHQPSDDDVEDDMEEQQEDEESEEEEASDEDDDEEPSEEGTVKEEANPLLAKMQARIEAANDQIAELKEKLEGRELDGRVPQESIDNAASIEDKRDELLKKLDAGEMTELEYAQQMTESTEALAKIFEAWERTTASQAIASSDKEAA